MAIDLNKHVGIYENEEQFSNGKFLTVPWVACIGNGTDYIVKYSSAPIAGSSTSTDILNKINNLENEKIFLTQDEYENMLAHPDESLQATPPLGEPKTYVFNDNKDKLFFTYDPDDLPEQINP